MRHGGQALAVAARAFVAFSTLNPEPICPCTTPGVPTQSADAFHHGHQPLPTWLMKLPVLPVQCPPDEHKASQQRGTHVVCVVTANRRLSCQARSNQLLLGQWAAEEAVDGPCCSCCARCAGAQPGAQGQALWCGEGVEREMWIVRGQRLMQSDAQPC